MNFQKFLEFREAMKKPMNIYEYSALLEQYRTIPNTWGGRRAGAGRKKQGITKKVSLTLTEEEWDYIDKSGAKTVGEYIKLTLKTIK